MTADIAVTGLQAVSMTDPNHPLVALDKIIEVVVTEETIVQAAAEHAVAVD